MELWHGSLADFVREAKATSLPGTMLLNFWNHHGYAPSTSEIRSWEKSLDALADALQGLQAKDIGVVLEYHLPYSGYRIDVLLAGKTSNGANCVMALELKQWSDVNLADNSLNVVINGVEHLHPSQQALDYSEHLSEIHSSFSEYSIMGTSCSFCHNLPENDETLNGPQFCSLLELSPLFKNGEEALLVDFIENWVGGGDGEHLMEAFIKGRFKPNKRLLDVLDAVVKRDEQWHLLDEQRIAYNAIWGNVATAIYELVYNLVEKGDWQSLTAFEENEQVSRGIKAGIITPTLYFLNPQYRLINSKTIDTVNFLLNQNAIGRDLSHYREYLDTINQALRDLGNPLFDDADIFDSFCHWMCDQRLGGYARRKEIKVPPEDDPQFEEEPEPQNHWEAIHYLVKTGNKLGYKTYVADPAKSAFDKKLGELASLAEVPPILKSAPEISRVDVIWYHPMPPFFLFEVEDGGTMREALHRLYNTMAFDAKFFIVSPLHNWNKFQKWVATAPFKEFEERYNFMNYTDLFDLYNEVVKFIAMRERILKL